MLIRFVFIISMLFPIVAHAALEQQQSYSDVIITLKSLAAQKQFFKIHTITTSLPSYFGETSFDYYHGIASLYVKDSDHAVFAFERLVSAKPNWHKVRYYLIQSYLLINNHSAAKSQSLILLNDSDTPLSIKIATEKLVKYIEEKSSNTKRTLLQSVSVGYGYDNNVNAGTREDKIFIPSLGELLLLPESQKADDQYINLGHNISYFHPLSQQSNFRVGLHSAIYRLEDFSQYDRLATTLSSSYRLKYEDIIFSTAFSVAPLWLDSELYRVESIVSFGSDLAVSKSLGMFSELGYGVVDNKIESKLDNRFYTVNLGFNYLFDTSFHSLSANYKSETADMTDGEYNARDIWGISSQSNIELASKLLFQIALGYQWIDFSAHHPLFLEKREDEMFLVASTIRYLINNDISVSLAINYQDKTSNLALFKYDRLDSSLSLNYAF